MQLCICVSLCVYVCMSVCVCVCVCARTWVHVCERKREGEGERGRGREIGRERKKEIFVCVCVCVCVSARAYTCDTILSNVSTVFPCAEERNTEHSIESSSYRVYKIQTCSRCVRVCALQDLLKHFQEDESLESLHLLFFYIQISSDIKINRHGTGITEISHMLLKTG